MSRRGPRTSLELRQTDALTEFENFKKRFLLVNKQLTKLNSSLNVQIKDLHAQIAALLSENVGLRSSNVALLSQLQREKDKSRKIMADAEAATAGLVTYLSSIRASMKIPNGLPSKSSALPPMARKPVKDPNASPPANRLARAPEFAEIAEEDEEDERQASPSPTARKRKTKPRVSSGSRLPVFVPIPPSAPENNDGLQDTLDNSEARKTSRRHSGQVELGFTSDSASSVTTASSAPYVTTRRPRHSVSAQEVNAALIAPALLRTMSSSTSPPVTPEDEIDEVVLVRKEKRSRTKDKYDDDGRIINDMNGSTTTTSSRKRSEGMLVDLTNSPRKKLAALDKKKSFDPRHVTPEQDPHPPGFATPAGHSGSSSEYPTPNSNESSPFIVPAMREEFPQDDVIDVADALLGGREKRSRKSVNYAEPKLNTKMRKPRDWDDTSSVKRRSSTSTRPRASETEAAPWVRGAAAALLSEEDMGLSTDAADVDDAVAEALAAVAGQTMMSAMTAKRKRPSSRPTFDDDESDRGSQADSEYAVSRRKSMQAEPSRHGTSTDLGSRRHSLAT